MKPYDKVIVINSSIDFIDACGSITQVNNKPVDIELYKTYIIRDVYSRNNKIELFELPGLFYDIRRFKLLTDYRKEKILKLKENINAKR